MKGNQYRKLHPMDKFAKKYLCKNAKRNRIKEDKHRLRRAVRIAAKEEIKEGLE